MQDQAERPLLFHGTTAVFKDSIRRYGLSHRRRSYKYRQIQRVRSILRRRGLIAPSSGAVLNDGILENWTGSSVREKGYSLTFDWVNALDFAVRNRCGETIELFSCLLENVCSAGGFDELPEPEHREVTDAYKWVSGLMAGHKPLVVGVRFDPQWFAESRVSFFTDPEVFKRLTGLPLLGHREMYLGSYDPAKVYTHSGDEFPSIRDIPASAIMLLTELNWNDELNALLQRVLRGSH